MILILLTLGLAFSAIESDRMGTMPHCPALKNGFSGYLPVGDDRELHTSISKVKETRRRTLFCSGSMAGQDAAV
jgi:hypothetical protein